MADGIVFFAWFIVGFSSIFVFVRYMAKEHDLGTMGAVFFGAIYIAIVGTVIGLMGDFTAQFPQVATFWGGVIAGTLGASLMYISREAEGLAKRASEWSKGMGEHSDNLTKGDKRKRKLARKRITKLRKGVTKLRKEIVSYKNVMGAQAAIFRYNRILMAGTNAIRTYGLMGAAIDLSNTAKEIAKIPIEKRDFLETKDITAFGTKPVPVIVALEVILPKLWGAIAFQKKKFDEFRGISEDMVKILAKVGKYLQREIRVDFKESKEYEELAGEQKAFAKLLHGSPLAGRVQELIRDDDDLKDLKKWSAAHERQLASLISGDVGLRDQMQKFLGDKAELLDEMHELLRPLRKEVETLETMRKQLRDRDPVVRQRAYNVLYREYSEPRKIGDFIDDINEYITLAIKEEQILRQVAATHGQILEAEAAESERLQRLAKADAIAHVAAEKEVKTRIDITRKVGGETGELEQEAKEEESGALLIPAEKAVAVAVQTVVAQAQKESAQAEAMAAGATSTPSVEELREGRKAEERDIELESKLEEKYTLIKMTQPEGWEEVPVKNVGFKLMKRLKYLELAAGEGSTLVEDFVKLSPKELTEKYPEEIRTLPRLLGRIRG